MKKLVASILIGLLLITSYGNCQEGLKNAPATKYVTAETSETFLISTKPVTNREYIIYILWIYNVYGIDYPDNIVSAIPGMTASNDNLFIDELSGTQSPFQVIFNYAPNFVKNYVFNPRYIDYPVIGLSQMQASKFCKWLSDRYNENNLIQKGYFKTNPMQINEDCFVTESYLVDQYYGARIKDETIKWSDRLLIPTFRLPSSNELNIANSQKLLINEFKSYLYDSTYFLNYWNNLFLNISEKSLKLNLSLDRYEIINATDKEWLSAKQANEELIYENSSMDRSKQIKDYLEIEKDSLGQMPFVIISENQNKEPVIVKNGLFDSVTTDTNKLYIFRFACSISPGQFK